MTRKIRDVMSPGAASVEPMTTVARAARVMREQDIGDVLVAYDCDLFGVLTDRDIVVRAIAEGLPPQTTTLESIATRELIMVEQSASVEEAVRAMRERGVRRLLVCDSDRKVVGILSLSDLALLPASA